MKRGLILFRDAAQADMLAGQVRAPTTELQSWTASFGGDGTGLLRALKFAQVGFHPLDGHALNAIERVNQIWTYLAALSAVRVLFELHSGIGSFTIAPGAPGAQSLDSMSEVEGLVGAEIFAAVDPRNNRKLAGRAERHRYAFFASPQFPGTTRLPQLERGGVQVWSVDV